MEYNNLDLDFNDIDLSGADPGGRRSQNSGRRTVPSGGRRRRRRKKKKKKRNILVAILPPLIAILLIAVVVLVSVKTGLFESFSYSTETQDLYEYFGIADNASAVVVIAGEPTEGRIRIENGTPYMSLADIKELYTGRFFYEKTSNRLLYTKEDETISTEVGTSSYETGGGRVDTPYLVSFSEESEEGQVIFLALDYVKLFKNLSVRLYGGEGEPYRIELKTVWGSVNTADITKKHSLRTEADKKSKILTELSEGEAVTVLEQGEEFSRVVTEDLITGYAENRYLGKVTEMAETPVTEVPDEVMTSLNTGESIVLMWHSIAGAAGNDTFSSVTEGTKGINVIAPTWFSIESETGTIRSFASKSYVEAAHAKGMKVWAVVDDFNANSSLSLYDTLAYAEKRAAIIANLISLSRDCGADGINVDFETIGKNSGDVFIQFIRELCVACHKNNLVVSVDNYVPKTFNTFYNRKEQGVFADYVVIMGYDEHYAGSKVAGSVASIGFVREGIEETLKEVPANKVINAVPFYTRVWEETPKTDEEIAAIDPGEEYVTYNLSVLVTPSMKNEEELLNNYHATATWDAEAMQNYATWKIGEKTYEVWLEDSASLTAKLEFMKAFELAGVAGWEISLAAPYVWDIIVEYY
ncbi:MAG: SH3 domain-containing protein [Lachnospiraceae bacterium]|nr:SH3 domain-containing protein [Lachnospiraceae bacterium]